MPNIWQGRFVTFEGGEGAGKSTQIKLLASKLAASGLEVVTTREPGGTPGAEAIRELILNREMASFGALTETLLFYAARHDHVEKRIRPALERGATVLCDRFTDSTRAYQGVLGHVSEAEIATIEAVTLRALKPDLTILIDIPAETGLQRAAARRGVEVPLDRFEAESIEFHQQIRKAFLRIAAQEPARCLVVNGEQPADTIAEMIYEAGTEFLARRAAFKSGSNV